MDGFGGRMAPTVTVQNLVMGGRSQDAVRGVSYGQRPPGKILELVLLAGHTSRPVISGFCAS